MVVFLAESGYRMVVLPANKVVDFQELREELGQIFPPMPKNSPGKAAAKAGRSAEACLPESHRIVEYVAFYQLFVQRGGY